MFSQDSAIPAAGHESVSTVQHSVGAGMTLFRTRAVLVTAMAAIFALALKPATAKATTYTVNTLQDTSSNGDCSLRDAINAANGTPTSGSTCNAAGTGKDTINFSVSGTILLLELGSLVYIVGLPEVTDTGLTITGPITIDGGGILVGTSGSQVMRVASGARLTLNSVKIVDTSSYFLFGGCVYNAGTLLVSDSTFSGNDGVDGGAGIYNDGTLTITSTTFSGNGSGPNGPGGGIYNAGALTVTDCTFSGNYGKFAGGGIYNTGMLRVTNTTFSGNWSSTIGGGPGAGGGIENYGTLTVSGSTFSGNTVGYGGEGAGIGNSGTLTVMNSTFLANKGIGGQGDDGGGIYNNGTLAVTNSTFSSNGGSAIYNLSSASVKSTILVGSSDSNCSGTITDAGYNISDDNSCGFSGTGSRNSTNALLSTDGLANNGGPTQTIALDPESPAMDAIPVTDCTDQTGNPITTDQRGVPRPDFGQDVCDIGAYESQESFAGQPGKANCHGQSVSALSNIYGSLDRAASALGFPSVQALQSAIKTFCGGYLHVGLLSKVEPGRPARNALAQPGAQNPFM